MIAIAIDRLESPDPWKEITVLTEQISRIDGIRRVDSLSSVPLIRRDADGSLSLTPGLEAFGENPDLRPVDIGMAMSRDRIAGGSLISEDGRVAGINALLEPDIRSDFERLIEEVRGVIPTHAWISGVPIFRTEINKQMREEISSFAIITIGAIVGILRIGFGTFSAAIHPIAVGVLGMWVLLGLMGLSGAALTLSTMILPSIMIALGCAYVMHFSTASVISKNRELALSLEDVGTPIAFSGLTTVIGFLGIAFTRIDAVHEVGIFGGVGVLVTLFAALTVAPALLAIFPIRQDEQWLARMISERGADWVKRIACERRLIVVALTASVGFLSLGGLFRLRLETDATQWFVRGTSSIVVMCLMANVFLVPAMLIREGQVSLRCNLRGK